MNVKEFDNFFGDHWPFSRFPSKIVDSVFPSKTLNSAILSVFRPKPFRSVLKYRALYVQLEIFHGSHSVTCHRTQVNIPCHNPSQTWQYLIYLPRRDGRLGWPRWPVTYWDGLPTHRWSPIQL